MRPLLRAAMPWATACDMCSGPNPLMLVTFCQKAGSVFKKGMGVSQPALLTRKDVGAPVNRRLELGHRSGDRRVVGDVAQHGHGLAAGGLDDGHGVIGASRVDVEHANRDALGAQALVTMAALPFSPRMGESPVQMEWQEQCDAPGSSTRAANDGHCAHVLVGMDAQVVS